MPSCCPFSLASYENLQRAFSETSIQSSPLRSMLWPFSALIQVKRVSPLRPFPSYSPLLLVAKIFMALELPPSQFIRYRDPCRCILRIFHPHRRLRRRSFYNRSIRTRVLFSPSANVSRNYLTTRAARKRRDSLISPMLLLCAHTSQMGNSAFKLSLSYLWSETRSGEEIWRYRLWFPPKLSRNLLLDAIQRYFNLRT